MAALRDLPWLLLIWSARHRIVEGLEVRVAGSAEESAEVFARVGEAVRLVAHHDPRLFARLRRDVRRILFTESSGGHYLAGLRTCRIGIAYARRVTPVKLAMMLVHEATHARIHRAGFRYAGKCRERIERICVEAEVAFAERVHGSEAAIAQARALLETRWWDAEKSAEDTGAELRRRGVPTWLVERILRRVRSRAQHE